MAVCAINDDVIIWVNCAVQGEMYLYQKPSVYTCNYLDKDRVGLSKLVRYIEIIDFIEQLNSVRHPVSRREQNREGGDDTRLCRAYRYPKSIELRKIVCSEVIALDMMPQSQRNNIYREDSRGKAVGARARRWRRQANGSKNTNKCYLNS